MLKVSKKSDGRAEIFYSIQGEGTNMGKPAVFLRLGLCNLKCSWCDTKYTWDWTKFNVREQLVDLRLEDVEQGILSYNQRYLVVTGGEPLIQQNQIIPLLQNLKRRGFFIEIETNGTLMPDQRLLALIDHWSVSPKLHNSGNSQPEREIETCYRLFNDLNSSHFKYVLQNEADFEEVQILVNRYNLVPEKIILMPEAVNKNDLIKRSRWLVELCKAQGYTFSIRLQLLLWGNERGK